MTAWVASVEDDPDLRNFGLSADDMSTFAAESPAAPIALPATLPEDFG